MFVSARVRKLIVKYMARHLSGYLFECERRYFIHILIVNLLSESYMFPFWESAKSYNMIGVRLTLQCSCLVCCGKRFTRSKQFITIMLLFLKKKMKVTDLRKIVIHGTQRKCLFAYYSDSEKKYSYLYFNQNNYLFIVLYLQ